MAKFNCICGNDKFILVLDEAFTRTTKPRKTMPKPPFFLEQYNKTVSNWYYTATCTSCGCFWNAKTIDALEKTMIDDGVIR